VKWDAIDRSILMLLITLAVGGCATVESPYRGKLSDAMEVSSDEYEGERHLQVPESQPAIETETDEALEGEMTSTSSSLAASNGAAESGHWNKNVAVSKGFGSVAGSDYGDQTSWWVRAGGEDMENTRSELFLGAEQVSIASSSQLYQSVDGNLKILVAGVNLKHFYGPYSSPVRPYLSFGGGGAYMFWSYRNSFTTSDGETISGDNLTGLIISTAAGIEFKPVDIMSFVVEVNPKAYLWMNRTGKGFDNDEFDPMALIAVTVGVSVVF